MSGGIFEFFVKIICVWWYCVLKLILWMIIHYFVDKVGCYIIIIISPSGGIKICLDDQTKKRDNTILNRAPLTIQ